MRRHTLAPYGRSMAATSPSTSHITSHITALTTFTGAAAAHYQRYFVPAIGAPAASSPSTSRS